MSAKTKLEKAEVIIETVMSVLDVKLRNIRSANKKAENVQARQIAAYLVNKHTILSYRAIGLLMRRSKKTAMYSIERAKVFIEVEEDFSILVERVEDRLKLYDDFN